MTWSLRQKLVVRVVLAVAAVMVLSGIALNILVSRGLRSRFDNHLHDRAVFLATEVEIGPEGVSTDLAEFDQVHSTDTAEDEFIQVLGATGTIHFLSTARRGVAIPTPATGSRVAEYSTLNLEDGRRLRCVHLGFYPKFGDELEDGNPGLEPRDLSIALLMTVARGTATLEHDLAQFRLLLGVMVSATLLVLLIAIMALIRATLAPVETLAAQIARLEPEGSSAVPIDTAIPAEFQPIVARLNDLLSKMKKVLEREKTFTADFSHEMRTPVAGLRTILEVGLTKDRTPVEYRELLQESLDVSLGLQALTETMLTLRRLESGAAQLRATRFPLADMVAEISSAVADAADERNMTLEVTLEPDAVVFTDRPLLELAVRNLVGNAVAHGRSGSCVVICGNRCENGAILEISNPCDHYSMDDVADLRTRFRRGDLSRSADNNHFGLGLALVDAIANVLNLRVDMQVTNADVFVVRLLFSDD